MLGEKITATIKAKYYFGAPVTKAKVKYKVLRTSHDARWYPLGPLGLVLRPRLLVVRLRLRLVSRLAASGAAAGRCRLVVAAAATSRRKSCRERGRRSAPTARSRSRSTPPSPRSCTATRTTVHDHGRSRRRVAADDRRHGQRARRPQAVQGLRLGRPRLLPRRRHGQGQLPGPDARPQAGRGQGRAEAAARSPTTTRASRSRTPVADLGARHRRRGPRPAADQGGAGRAVPPVVQADRRARSTRSKAATSSSSSATASTARSSASTTSS